MTTRSKSNRFNPGGRATCLKHVLEQILEVDSTSPLYISVLQHFGNDENKFNVIDFFLCDTAFFENLTYVATVIANPAETDPTKVISKTEVCSVPNYLRARCIFFKRFLEDRRNDGQDLNYESFYMGLTLEEFMEWKAEEMTMNNSSPRVAKSRDLVADFKKGIKRDPSQFPSLKHIDNWPTFKRETLAQATAQDVVNVFNPKYKPRGSEERELFALQLYYVYAIFCSNLKTDFGRKLVRDHESSQDAQKIWAALSDDAEKSTVAQLNATDLLQYVHTARVENWKGTTLSFILHYQEQIRLYDQLQPPNEQTSDHAKMIYLQNAVYAIEELRSVQTTGSQLALANGTVPIYKDYEALLKSAASTYDRAHAPAKRQPTRSVERTDIWDANVTESYHDAYDFGFDIDTPTAIVQAHMRDQSGMIAKEPFSHLSKESQKAWSQLSDDVRVDILRVLQKSSQRSQESTRPTSLSDKPRYNRTRVPQNAAINRTVQFDLVDDAATTPSSLTASVHDTSSSGTPTPNDPDLDDRIRNVLSHILSETTVDGESDKLIASVTKQAPTQHREWSQPKAGDVPASDLRKMLSQRQGPEKPSIKIHGVEYVAKLNDVMYQVSNHNQTKLQLALIDRGANGGVAGSDTRLIDKSLRSVNIQGIDDHMIEGVPIGTVGAVVNTQRGEVIAIMHQYAYTGKGGTIHSSGQLEWCGNDVNDRSIKIEGGKQRLTTPDGYVIPIDIRRGLPYIKMRPFTDDEFDTLPHVVWTGEDDWDPTSLDSIISDDPNWYETEPSLPLPDPMYDEYGEFRGRVLVNQREWQVHYFDALDKKLSPDDDDEFHDAIEQFDDDPDSVIDFIVYRANRARYVCDHETVEAAPKFVKTSEPDYGQLRPRLGWLSIDAIKKTFENTTQLARMPMSTILRKRYKSPNPALNVRPRDEAVATDTIYSDTPAIDSGVTSAQLFVGTKTNTSDVYPIKTDKQFVNTLLDNITERGAPTKLISDRAQVEISERVKQVLRPLHIGTWQSEPHQQHQNPAERQYQNIKRLCNTILDRSGAPAYTWLLCLIYVCFLLNNTWCESVGDIPIRMSTGSTNDISPLLCFYFWEPVYYKLDDSDFPSDSREKRGHFVGISESVGHAMTFKVLTDDTLKVIHRSNVRSALNPHDKNLRLDPLEPGDVATPIVKSRHDSADDGEILPPMPIIDPSELIGRTFLMDKEDGQRHRARILNVIDEEEICKRLDKHERELFRQPGHVQFVCSVNDDAYEEILSYNELMDYIEKDEQQHQDEDGNGLWKFKRVIGHEGPFKPSDPEYKGSRYNVLVEWENGEITSEPLSIFGKDDPVTCAVYAREHGLLEEEGWRRFKGIAKREKKMLRMVNQSRIKATRNAPKYKFGYRIPRNYDEAMQLDLKNGNTLWHDAIVLEMSQLAEYDTFYDLGHKDTASPPAGYKKIRTHLVFDVKHDGRHKARMVADGHLTDIPLESVYSGVVSLRGLRMVTFLAELNGLELWATDIGNAYLEAYSAERNFIIAGPEFGELEGHYLIIVKALYGLRTSGLRWHERFADCLRNEGFTPCKAEPDIWMRLNGDLYEYIATYVDDIACAMRDPKSFTDTLQQKYNFKLKGTGPISYHLGQTFSRNENGEMEISAKRYVDKMMDTYVQLYGEKPRKVSSPLEQNDHPEMDDSPFLGQDETQQYQSLIGAMQWAVSIGRLDIATAVMSLSSFRAMPRRGHLERAKRIYGYLRKMKEARIRVLTKEPDYSDYQDPQYDWSSSVYGDVKEIIPTDIPETKGKYVTLSHYFDANLYHDMITGRSVTAILHFLNQTPIDWYSKKQATVETATFGSEFIAARTTIDQIVDLRTTLRYLGVPIREKSYVFGDNKTVIDSSSTPHAKLHKRHNALSFHRVREAVASKYVSIFHLPGEYNPADILSKHWAYASVWRNMNALLFARGDTWDLLDDECGEE